MDMRLFAPDRRAYFLLRRQKKVAKEKAIPCHRPAARAPLRSSLWWALLGFVVCLNLLFFFVKFCVLGLLLEKPLSLPFDATTN